MSNSAIYILEVKFFEGKGSPVLDAIFNMGNLISVGLTDSSSIPEYVERLQSYCPNLTELSSKVLHDVDQVSQSHIWWLYLAQLSHLHGVFATHIDQEDRLAFFGEDNKVLLEQIKICAFRYSGIWENLKLDDLEIQASISKWHLMGLLSFLFTIATQGKSVKFGMNDRLAKLLEKEIDFETGLLVLLCLKASGYSGIWGNEETYLDNRIYSFMVALQSFENLGSVYW